MRELQAHPPLLDADKKDGKNPEACHQIGTLRDLLDSDGIVALNALDLPLVHPTVKIPPLFSDISTDAYSYNIVKHLLKVRPMPHVTSWGTGSTGHSVSEIHWDDEGFGTIVSVQTGAKWWVVANRKRELAVHVGWDEMSDVNVLHAWKVNDIQALTWEVEAVHLQPTCVL